MAGCTDATIVERVPTASTERFTRVLSRAGFEVSAVRRGRENELHVASEDVSAAKHLLRELELSIEAPSESTPLVEGPTQLELRQQETRRLQTEVMLALLPDVLHASIVFAPKVSAAVLLHAAQRPEPDPAAPFDTASMRRIAALGLGLPEDHVHVQVRHHVRPSPLASEPAADRTPYAVILLLCAVVAGLALRLRHLDALRRRPS